MEDISLNQFKNSVETGHSLPNLPLHLLALWFDGRGDWQKAHNLIDHLNDKHSAHVHAYLHRKEGDLWNADYWYSRAGQSRPNSTLEEEWEELVNRYLKKGMPKKAKS